MVYFIGAGAGDVKLLTLRGKEILERADVVIYAGSLVNPALLDFAKADAEIYNSATMTLEDVLAVIFAAERDGKMTARLHTGDPSLYSTIYEQIVTLRKREIPFAVIPGVSSFSAAAAALGMEYTLPERTQTLIISRVEGRTPMPARENLAALASHGASMVLFLSVGMAKKVQRELLSEKSGYTDDTPCAVVYKASWDDEKIVCGKLSELPAMVRDNRIEKTALILVGDAVSAASDLAENVPRSRLYAPNFSTGFRAAADDVSAGSSGVVDDMLTEIRATRDEASTGNIPLISRQDSAGQPEKIAAILSFTDGGAALASKIVSALTDENVAAGNAFAARHYAFGKDFSDTSAFVGEWFSRISLFVFVGAAGIAVRSIAPYLKDKATDPAVLCVDETGAFVVPVLSGHLGGANDFAKRLADAIGATPVITTATDRRNVFAVDLFAKEQGLAFADISSIKEVSARLLRGETVGFCDTTGGNYFPDGLPDGLRKVSVAEAPRPDDGMPADNFSCGIIIANHLDTPRPFSVECRLYPRNLCVGIGCKEGKTKDELLSFLRDIFAEHSLPTLRICKVASIDKKANEAGICELAGVLNVPFRTFSADELLAAPEIAGGYAESEFVAETVGVGNVCERSAVVAANGGELFIRKTARDGMTIAVAEVVANE